MSVGGLNSNIISIGGGIGGGSFAIGPLPNEFRAETRNAAVGLLNAQTAAGPDWTLIYDAAPLGQDSLAPLNVKLYYNEDGVAVVELDARSGGEWVVNQAFSGVSGVQGIEGPTGEKGAPGEAGKEGPKGQPGKDGAGVTPEDQVKLDAIKIIDKNFVVGDFIAESITANEVITSLNSLSFDGVMTLGSGGEGLVLTDTIDPGFTYKFMVMHGLGHEFPTGVQKKPLEKNIPLGPEGHDVLTDPEYVTVLPEDIIIIKDTIHIAEDTNENSRMEVLKNGVAFWRVPLTNIPTGVYDIELASGVLGLYPLELAKDISYTTKFYNIKLLGNKSTGKPWETIDYHPAVTFEIKPSSGTAVKTNLSGSSAGNDFIIDNDNGTGVTIPSSSTESAGVMTVSNYTKLQSIEEGAQVNNGKILTTEDDPASGYLSEKIIAGDNVTVSVVNEQVKIDAVAQVEKPTNLEGSPGGGTYTVTNDNGTGFVIDKATDTKAGVMSAQTWSKLHGIESGAQVNDGKILVDATDTKSSYLKDKITHGRNVTIKEVTGAEGSSLEISAAEQISIGGIEVKDISGEGLYFETSSNEDFVIPQVEYIKDTKKMGTPFFYSKKPIKTIYIDEYVLASDVVLAIPYNHKSGFSYEGTDDVVITGLTLDMPDRTVGKYISVKFGYFPKDSGSRIYAYTGRTLINKKGVNIIDFSNSFQIGTDSSIAKSISIEISEADHEVAGPPSDYAHVMGGPNIDYPWWQLVSGSPGEKTNLATQDFSKSLMFTEVYNKSESPTAYVKLVNYDVVVTSSLGVGSYMINFSCGFKCDSSNDARWCQAELKANGTLIGMATNGISNIGTQANYCSIEKSTMFTSSIGDTKAEFTLTLSSSNPSKINYRGLTMTILKMGVVA